MFINNTATDKGGAIYYNLQKPTMNLNTFEGNTAEYGPNLASYAVKIVEYHTKSNKVKLENIASGLQYDKELYLSVIDADDQVMNLENEYTINIVASDFNSAVLGISSVRMINGTSHFNNLIFANKPGNSNVKFEMTSKLLDQQQIKYGVELSTQNQSLYENNIFVNFRFYKPGEIEDHNKCRE